MLTQFPSVFVWPTEHFLLHSDFDSVFSAATACSFYIDHWTWGSYLREGAFFGQGALVHFLQQLLQCVPDSGMVPLLCRKVLKLCTAVKYRTEKILKKEINPHSHQPFGRGTPSKHFCWSGSAYKTRLRHNRTGRSCQVTSILHLHRPAPPNSFKNMFSFLFASSKRGKGKMLNWIAGFQISAI